MKKDISEQQIKEILQVLDDLIENGPWDSSNFLRVIAKNIEGIRQKLIDQTLGKSYEVESHLANRMAVRSGQQEIYILLYSSEGGHLPNWERIIATLPRHTASRPIYAEEKDVLAAMRATDKPLNQAYVAVYIQQSDILELEEDKIPLDKLGKQLISLKDKSIKLNSITRFVHKSGTYQFENLKLQKPHFDEGERD